jgi:hypothetical protein
VVGHLWKTSPCSFPLLLCFVAHRIQKSFFLIHFFMGGRRCITRNGPKRSAVSGRKDQGRRSLSGDVSLSDVSQSTMISAAQFSTFYATRLLRESLLLAMSSTSRCKIWLGNRWDNVKKAPIRSSSRKIYVGDGTVKEKILLPQHQAMSKDVIFFFPP